eukprot:GHVU01114136.1.p2 GENE.GHVU01114136.1~~GHVU01114136.1.p2  ORF type:complete len:112 (-),score=5.58 GHVU01114136.1:378-713(-)
MEPHNSRQVGRQAGRRSGYLQEAATYSIGNQPSQTHSSPAHNRDTLLTHSLTEATRIEDRPQHPHHSPHHQANTNVPASEHLCSHEHRSRVAESTAARDEKSGRARRGASG